MRMPFLGLMMAASLIVISPGAAAQTNTDASGYRADALAVEPLIRAQYAYLDHLPGGVVPTSPNLRAAAAAVSDSASLLRYVQHALITLSDHHAITGRSFADDWAIVPTYADLWIEMTGDDFVVNAVREGSPARLSNVQVGDRLVAVDDVPIDQAIEGFWTGLGLKVEGDRAAFTARVLAAGRRDRPRTLTLAGASGTERRLILANLYGDAPDRPSVEIHIESETTVIRLNDSLGGDQTVADFDATMAEIPADRAVIIDLTDTPSGGNTVVARAIMGWFATRPTGYQVHNLPSEERQTGIPRQWIEQVLPRAGKHHQGPVTVRVGRWTGSMGEGLAIGFLALGARVEGGRMAGLRGAITDLILPNSGLVLKLPTERLLTIDGTPREAFAPK